MFIETLSLEESTAVLDGNSTASLACVRDKQPYTVPINYAFSEGTVYSFSREGQKIAWMRDNQLVSLLVVVPGPGRTWESVIATGSFEELNATPDGDNERAFAFTALSAKASWWETASLKSDENMPLSDVSYIYYCIRINQLTGRAARDELPAVR